MKTSISISIEEETLKKVKKELQQNKEKYRNISHYIEFLITEKK